MSEPRGGYLQNLLILFFALSIVFIGAGEIQKKEKNIKARAGESTKDAKEIVRDLKGGDIRASISRQAVKEISAGEKRRSSVSAERSDGGFWSRWFPQARSKPVRAQEDQLDGEDRKQLDDLLGKVSR